MVAQVQRPAPGFTKAAAVVDGLFEDISLSDYMGKWCVQPIREVNRIFNAHYTLRITGLFCFSTLCTCN